MLNDCFVGLKKKNAPDKDIDDPRLLFFITQ